MNSYKIEQSCFTFIGQSPLKCEAVRQMERCKSANHYEHVVD